MEVGGLAAKIEQLFFFFKLVVCLVWKKNEDSSFFVVLHTTNPTTRFTFLIKTLQLKNLFCLLLHLDV